MKLTLRHTINHGFLLHPLLVLLTQVLLLLLHRIINLLSILIPAKCAITLRHHLLLTVELVGVRCLAHLVRIFGEGGWLLLYLSGVGIHTLCDPSGGFYIQIII